MEKCFTAISLFSSSGIGDVALKKCGINTIVANELLPDRCSLFRRNFPETHLVEGSIEEKKSEIIAETKLRLDGTSLDFALVTPPCQGMSKNGRGKLLAEINAGRRPKIDPRNLLILPALEIIKELKPTTVIFENVSEMVNTSIPFNGDVTPIIEIIKTELNEYQVEAKVIEFADFGVPQRRLRLITIATRNKKLVKHKQNFGSLFPLATHSRNPSKNLKKWVTVRDTIAHMEVLDGKDKLVSNQDPLHKISKLDELKYWWVKNTPANKSAFDNQCIECGYDGNPNHSSKKDTTGVNRASSETPLYCKQCKSLLPRPTVQKNGALKLMTGFTSAYKRMDWNLPASAITRNFPYACSDNKIHPEQHRTLSIREACMLHTISESDFYFETEIGVVAKHTTIRDTLGESVPPMILQIIFNNLNQIAFNDLNQNDVLDQKQLIFA
jgi:DNA (cytosine-5)-methyltransferase 1